jgi:uncharacterized protein YjcR
MGKGTVKAYEYLIEQLYTEKLHREVKFHEVMKILYIDEEKSILDIANMFKVSSSTVHSWLRREGIATRKLTFK